MAKTIKELAKENIPPMGWYHFKDEAEECFLDGFEAGANAVLEEIEKLVKFNRWAAQDLYELIKQLKK